MSTSKDAAKISKGVLIVMFLIIVLLICFTEVRVYGNSLFTIWDDAQVLIYNKPKFQTKNPSSKNVRDNFRWFWMGEWADPPHYGVFDNPTCLGFYLQGSVIESYTVSHSKN